MTTAEPARTWASTEAAEIWRQGAARRAQILAVATERMLQAARLTPGSRVLDVAAGTGDQTLLAAQRVGPNGSILATDISRSMLAVAAQAARDAGLENIETKVADASALELPEAEFDAAICRFGLMFLPDVHAALVRIHRALKPDGRFAALVWSTEARNPWMGLPLGLVRELGRMPSPPPTIARTTSLGAAGRIEAVLRDAGFQDVHSSPVSTPREFASLDEAFATIQTSSPAQGELTRAMSPAELDSFAIELKRRLAGFVQADGRCLVPGEAILGGGTRGVED